MVSSASAPASAATASTSAATGAAMAGRASLMSPLTTSSLATAPFAASPAHRVPSRPVAFAPPPLGLFPSLSLPCRLSLALPFALPFQPTVSAPLPLQLPFAAPLTLSLALSLDGATSLASTGIQACIFCPREFLCLGMLLEHRGLNLPKTRLQWPSTAAAASAVMHASRWIRHWSSQRPLALLGLGAESTLSTAPGAGFSARAFPKAARRRRMLVNIILSCV